MCVHCQRSMSAESGSTREVIYPPRAKNRGKRRLNFAGHFARHFFEIVKQYGQDQNRERRLLAALAISAVLPGSGAWMLGQRKAGIVSVAIWALSVVSAIIFIKFLVSNFCIALGFAVYVYSLFACVYLVYRESFTGVPLFIRMGGSIVCVTGFFLLIITLFNYTVFRNIRTPYIDFTISDAFFKQGDHILITGFSSARMEVLSRGDWIYFDTGDVASLAQVIGFPEESLELNSSGLSINGLLYSKEDLPRPDVQKDFRIDEVPSDCCVVIAVLARHRPRPDADGGCRAAGSI